MKHILTALMAIAVISCTKLKPVDEELMPSIISAATPELIGSSIKNIQPIVSSTYDAFLTTVENNMGVTVFYRTGTSHTTGGKGAYRTISLSGKVSNQTIFHDDSLDVRDISGGKMDNDSTVLFYSTTNKNGVRNIFIQKADQNNSFSNPVLFNWDGIVNLNGGFFYGKLVKGDVPGESYNILYQMGKAPVRYRISIIKTTDYWNHYTECGVIYDGTIPYTETTCANLTGGKFLAISRNNVGGSLIPFESSNYGKTWIRRPSSNLFWYNSGLQEMADICVHDGVFDIFYQCRDASMMQISKGNTLSNFGKTYPVYNSPEIYAYHLGTGGNPSLGYGQLIKLNDGRFFTVFSKQYTNTKANLQWTFDNLETDPDGLPAAPPKLDTVSLSLTSFRINVNGYTDREISNIRYLNVDVSLDSTFSSFVTLKYQNPTTTIPAMQMHNIRMIGKWCTFNLATHGNEYWVRAQAVNNAGRSSWTIQKARPK